jgi:hypothetical protein
LKVPNRSFYEIIDCIPLKKKKNKNKKKQFIDKIVVYTYALNFAYTHVLASMNEYIVNIIKSSELYKWDVTSKIDI